MAKKNFIRTKEGAALSEEDIQRLEEILAKEELAKKVTAGKELVLSLFILSYCKLVEKDRLRKEVMKAYARKKDLLAEVLSFFDALNENRLSFSDSGFSGFSLQTMPDKGECWVHFIFKSLDTLKVEDAGKVEGQK